jgi:Holliday junction resolvase RusA-like endonuclease
MTDQHYTIRLEPRGKGRPVFSRATGSARTPETTRAWEHEAAHQLREQHRNVGFLTVEDVRLLPWDEVHHLWEVDVTAHHPRPKTRPAYIPREVWKMSGYTLPAATRHDLDNIVKITLDALQIARVVSNDRCIVSINAGSYFVAPGEDPRVDVVLREVTV